MNTAEFLKSEFDEHADVRTRTCAIVEVRLGYA